MRGDRLNEVVHRFGIVAMPCTENRALDIFAFAEEACECLVYILLGSLCKGELTPRSANLPCERRNDVVSLVEVMSCISVARSQIGHGFA